MRPIILVDANNLCFRSGFAYTGLSHDGLPTGMLYGTLKAVAMLKQQVSPNLVFCWDGIPGSPKVKNWRDAIVHGYKANRHHDEDLYRLLLAQMRTVWTALYLLGYSNVAVPGLEADDIIGIITAISGNQFLIYSSDKDFYQLLEGTRVQVLQPSKTHSGFQYVTQLKVEKELGIPINRYAEYLGLGGDSADDIKPAPGMGPKTALKIIQDGIDLPRTFAEQSKAFRSKWTKLQSCWERVLQCYCAAKLPREKTDLRIRAHIDGWPFFHTDQRPLKKSEEEFTRLCANHGLVSIIAKRHELFAVNQPNKQESEPCHKERNIPQSAPPMRRRRSLLTI